MPQELLPPQEIVIVNDIKIIRLVSRGQNVITFAMAADVHQVPVKTIQDSYARNAQYFVDGEDTWEMKGEELQQCKALSLFNRETPSARVFTQIGYYKLIKPMRDPQSWHIQGEMAKAYFRIQHGLHLGPPKEHVLSPMEKIEILRASLELAESFDLIDDYTRIIAREAIQNHIRMIGAIPGQEYTPASRQIGTGYFQVEALRDKLETKMKDKHWMNIRGTLGKMIGLAIQAANPDVKPLKVAKFVNGEERYVNAWPNEYMDIAIAAADQHLARASSQRD